MPSVRRGFKLFCAAFILSAAMSATAQDLPGSEVSDNEVNQSAITLANLAMQVYPDLFSQATSWRIYEGFHYKYFGSSGVYMGVSGSDLYLLGGPFGSEVTYSGTIADAIVVVQSAAAGSTSTNFQDYVTASTLNDLLSYFTKLTLEYGGSTTLGSTLLANTDASITLEAIGEEAVSGVTANRLKLTLSGSNLASEVIYDMWVDAQGVVVKLVLDGSEYNAATAKVVGPGLVSGMLLALVAAEQPSVKAVVANTLSDSSVVSQQTTDKTIGGVAVKSLAITVSSDPLNFIQLELSDFGNFTMATSYEAALDGSFQKSTSYFRIVDVELR